MTDYALVHDGHARRKVPVHRLTREQRVELGWDASSYLGDAEDFSTEIPVRAGW